MAAVESPNIEQFHMGKSTEWNGTPADYDGEMEAEPYMSPMHEVHDVNHISVGPNFQDEGNFAVAEEMSEHAESPDSERCPDGILDEETVSLGLSNMGRTADGNEVTFLHLTLAGYSLQDISILSNYSNIQKLEIPYNKLTDLGALSHMPYLVELDASHNELTKLLDFDPPLNLREVDMSFNKIQEMGKLSEHHALTKLVLDNNAISIIDGLESCVALQHLSLAHNLIKKIENLDHFHLRHLNLRNNDIEIMENLEHLKNLQSLNLSGNKVESLKGLDENTILENLDLENNLVADITEIDYIQDLRILRCLNLLRNPIQETPDYRFSLLFRMPQIAELDRRRAEAEEKVKAINLFSPPMEVVAAHDHRRCMVYSTLRAAKVHMSTLPTLETPYPILVLSGPSGAGKRELAHRLVMDFEAHFGFGITHTTRAPMPGEMDSSDFYFISAEDFDSQLKQGDYLLTYQTSGNSYALSLQAVESVAGQGLACVIPMELEGVLTFKLTHYQPRYILLLPLDQQKHKERLQAKGSLNTSQITHAVERTEIYQRMNQDKPGFFDRIIDSSDLDRAYKQLKSLVQTYLGLESSSVTPDSYEASKKDHSGSMFDSHSQVTASQSPSRSTPHSYGERPGTGSAGSGVKTWSKPHIEGASSQSLSQNLAIRQGSGKRMNSVELASYERRKIVAKAAAAGIIPKPLDQLVNKPPGTAPGEAKFDLGPEKPLRPSTVPSRQYRDLYLSSPDSSAPSTTSDSRLSNISEARGVSASNSPLHSETEDMLTGRDSRPGSGLSLTNQKPVLPPISMVQHEEDVPEY